MNYLSCDFIILAMEKHLTKSRQEGSLNCVNISSHSLIAMERLLVYTVPMVTTEQDF